MLRTRVIPVLLLKNNGLVKTTRFKNPVYVGDPINAVRIFNEKEVDELILLDISATKMKSEPNYDKIREIVSEAFMPLGYGGGLNNIDDIEKLFTLGVEKVVINSAALKNKNLIKSSADHFGSQSIVVSIDVKNNLFCKSNVFINGGRINTKQEPVEYAKKMEDLGAGEIFLNSINKDGTMTGFDIQLIKKVSEAVSVPVIANGGAGSLEDFYKAVKEGGASAVAAGSMFVFQGIHRAVLISYPEYNDLEILLNKQV